MSKEDKSRWSLHSSWMSTLAVAALPIVLDAEHT